MADDTSTATLSNVRTGNGFLELFYGTLFEPVVTFRRLADSDEGKGQALISTTLAVLLVSALTAVVQWTRSDGSAMALPWLILVAMVVGLMGWVWTVGGIALTAYAFMGKAHFRNLFILFGLAMWPGVLMAPIALLPQGLIGEPWSSFSLLLFTLPALLIWLWISILSTYAVVATYHMTVERVMALFLVPVIILLSIAGGFVGLLFMIVFAQFK